MLNFSYQNPTKILFGKDCIARISREIPPGSKVMITYGGGSVRKNGVLDEVKAALQWVRADRVRRDRTESHL